jgi:hypothetical protein
LIVQAGDAKGNPRRLRHAGVSKLFPNFCLAKLSFSRGNRAKKAEKSLFEGAAALGG